MNELQIASKIAQLLNEALSLDPQGFSKMVLAKHEINEALADHPTIQCGIITESKKQRKRIQQSQIMVDMVTSSQRPGLSALGLLNGLLENYAISAAVNDDDLIVEFAVMPIETFFPQEPSKYLEVKTVPLSDEQKQGLEINIRISKP